MVIRESIPIFYYNRDPEKALKDEWYILQSGFFVALSQFANEMSSEKLKYVILENKLYALDEVSDVLLVFSEKEKLDITVVNKLQNEISKAANYLTYLFEKHNFTLFPSSMIKINQVAKDFGEYLATENLVEDDTPFDPYKSRSMMQKFIFKSIGYKPGQCNIGPAQRMRRLVIGISSLAIGLAGALILGFLNVNPWFSLLLAVPLFMGFFGLFQYFFRFCAINGLTKKYNMH